ncbi:putative pentatricopeptide repeat-containing protein At1g09680 [Salvia miltiorrhiza]|uniref:putative pentatricopeptide repeat-containing protein At1g09680 n=1 Tax=Salvia miltiorrhiza TaxID=226208 RepID=UPI0025ABF4F3|nr:putative pentatricopeptide repeat-containing protein At1g09680 [Salvia miltiorrhiza]
MLSSKSCTFLHHSPISSAFNPNPPFFYTTNSFHRRKFHVFAAPIKENHHLHGHTSARKLQVEDFLQTVATAPEKLEALEKLHRNGEIQTINELNRLLVSLISSDEVELARKLKSSLSSLGLFPNVWTYSILVKGFCKSNATTEATSVLHEMLENGFEPNVATFTTLINSLCESGRMRDACEVFDVMSKIGCKPTINTFNCLLKGLCYVGRIEEAYDLLGRIKKSSIKPDIYSYTAMMDGFCKVGRSNEAMELLVEAMKMKLTPNVVMYNTLFNGYFKEGKPLRGFGLLRRMRERRCRPDYISYSTLLHGLLKWGKTRAALQVYKEMVGAGYRVDERMMNTLLRGLCRLARKEKYVLGDAYNVFEEMRNGEYAIYQEAYELVVEAFCCNGIELKMERSFEVLNEMIGIGFSPKTFTFNIAIHALCRCGEADKALAVLMMMHKDRNPRGIPFNLLIDELILQGRLLAACCVYGLALKRGVVPKRKPESNSSNGIDIF